jgi:hypothetical protein
LRDPRQSYFSRCPYVYVKGESDRWLRVTRGHQGDLHVRYDDEKDDTAFAHAPAQSADAFFR